MKSGSVAVSNFGIESIERTGSPIRRSYSAPEPPALREALGHFATGVTVVTCRDAPSQLHGVTANSFSSVSLDPPLILFSLGRALNSLGAFQQASHFAVNVLGAQQRELSGQFATPLGEKWRDVRYHSGLSGCPILEDALAVFECCSWQQYDGGDHIIFVCRVLRVSSNAAQDPLVFYRGDWLLS